MTGPELIVIRLLSVAAAVLAAYLALVTSAAVVLRVAGAHPLARALDSVTPAFARNAIAALMSVGLGVPTMARADTATTDPPMVMHRLPDESTATTTTTVPRVAAEAAPSPPHAPDLTWTIQPGQHFWAVAERVLERAWGRSPTDAEVVPYWRDLIAANRGRLYDRNNPDLVFPGQVLVLLPPPAAR